MRYLMILTDERPEPQGPPELMEAIMKLGEEASLAGVLLDTAGLLPSAVGGARVEVSDNGLTVSDGPFAESKELVSYAIYDVRSKEEAVEWASRFLQLHIDLWPGWKGETKLLKIFGPEDMPPQR